MTNREEGIGVRLKVAFQRNRLTFMAAQEQLSAAGVPGSSESNLYKILSDKVLPTTRFVIEASKELRVSAGWLLAGEGEMAPDEPFSKEDAERYGVKDLPGVIQNDVLGLARRLLVATDRTGLNLDQLGDRTAALSEGIAAWLRIPLLHSNKFRQLDPDLEATAFCDAALRALRLLIPRPGSNPTPGKPDKALVELTRLERRLAGRKKPRKTAPGKPEFPATVRTTLESEAPRKL